MGLTTAGGLTSLYHHSFAAVCGIVNAATDIEVVPRSVPGSVVDDDDEIAYFTVR